MHSALGIAIIAFHNLAPTVIISPITGFDSVRHDRTGAQHLGHDHPSRTGDGSASEFLELQILMLIGAALRAIVWVRSWKRLPYMVPLLEGVAARLD